MSQGVYPWGDIIPSVMAQRERRRCALYVSDRDHTVFTTYMYSSIVLSLSQTIKFIVHTPLSLYIQSSAFFRALDHDELLLGVRAGTSPGL